VLGKFPGKKFSDCTILLELTGRLAAIRFVLTFTNSFRQQEASIIAKSGNENFNLPSPEGWIPGEENIYWMENVSH
jgi:hypothetical protein